MRMSSFCRPRRLAITMVALLLGFAAAAEAESDWRVQSDRLVARVEGKVIQAIASPDSFRRLTDIDDTNAIQAALDTGNSVRLEANRTYVVGRPLVMRSRQRLFGAGPTTILTAGKGWVRPTPPDRNGFTMISNAGFLGETITDEAMVVEHMTINASAITLAKGNGAFHAIGFRLARDVMVRDVHCIAVGDCTAFEGVDGSLVADSTAFDVTNVGFDHWEGPRNAVVRNVQVRTLPSGAGVMFTAGAGLWAKMRGRAATNLVASDVVVEGRMVAGIIVNVLVPEGSVSKVAILDSRIDGQGQPGSGIVITGNVSDVEISGVTIENVTDGMAIGVRGDRWALPRNVRILGTRVVNAHVGEKGVAPIVLLGSGHRIESLDMVGGSYPFAVWTSDAGLALPSGVRGGSRGRSLRRSWEPSECRNTRPDC